MRGNIFGVSHNINRSAVGSINNIILLGNGNKGLKKGINKCFPVMSDKWLKKGEKEKRKKEDEHEMSLGIWI